MIVLLAALTLLIFTGGSLMMLVELLRVRGPIPLDDDSTKALLLSTRIVWPLILVLTGALGSVTFLAAGQPEDIILLVVGLLGANYAVRYPLEALAISDTFHLPLRGLPALLCILLFVVVNAVAMYSVWIMVFHAT